MKLTYAALKEEFLRVLLKRAVPEDIAKECAAEFADTTAYGVLSHGVNRFPVFINMMDKGQVRKIVEPQRVQSFGVIEQWDGQLGIGNLTAKRMMQRAVELASVNNVGIVALKNTNHWMRGGSYGYHAAKQGYIGICWTNSSAVMPAWGTKECCIGTNPLILGVPSDPVTLVDMSMSMFSYGKLQSYRLKKELLPLDGGFDDDGNLCRDPGIIEKNRRLLPMGYWKGSGLSIVLDMIAVALSDGLSVRDVTEQGAEINVTQIFIALKPLVKSKDNLINHLSSIADYVLNAAPADLDTKVRIPGQELEKRYAKALKEGITVDDGIFAQIKSL